MRLFSRASTRDPHQAALRFLKAWPDLGTSEASSLGQIAASDVDFVIVTTPPNARLEIVEAMVQAGKPILMEKPVERSLENASALVTMCEPRAFRSVSSCNIVPGPF